MNLRVCLIVFGVLTSVAFTPTGQRAEVVIKDVSVFSPQTGKMVPHQDIIVRGTLIAAVLPTGTSKVEAKTTINGSGKFVVPGLFDAHVHLSRLSEETAGLFLLFGVTSVRDMGDAPALIASWRERIAHGKFLGPRIVSACGPMLEGQGEQRPDHWVVSNASAADSVVAVIAAASMDCVKIRTFKDTATYFAIARAARHEGLMVTGHGFESIAPADALRAGQRTFEHAFYPYPFTNASEHAELFAAFRAADAALVPTLVAWIPSTVPADTLRSQMERAKANAEFQLPDALLAHWANSIQNHVQQRKGSPGWISAVNTSAGDIGTLFRNGVRVLVGSDTGAPFVTPGLAVHEELELLVTRSGMSPAEALTAATLKPAEFFGRGKDLGSIEPGKVADMLVLTKNPLLDIRNTRTIDAVVFRGEALTRAHLNGIAAATR